MGNPSKQDVSLLIGYPAVNNEGHKSQGFTAMFPGPAQAATPVRLPARPGLGSQDPFLASIVQGKTRTTGHNGLLYTVFFSEIDR